MAQISMSVDDDDADAALDQPGGGTAQLLWQPALGWGDFYYRYTLRNTSGKPQTRPHAARAVARHRMHAQTGASSIYAMDARARDT